MGGAGYARINGIHRARLVGRGREGGAHAEWLGGVPHSRFRLGVLGAVCGGVEGEAFADGDVGEGLVGIGGGARVDGTPFHLVRGGGGSCGALEEGG